MEFPFDINQLFSERVSVLDQSLIAGRKSAGRPDLQAHIATVIDELGRASAKAQQLTSPITSASKLQTQRHQLYLLKDGESNGGRGVVVGFLKVGYKKLFLLDRQGLHIEAEPLCVLDFYISENLQRHGYGLELFDFMLQHKSLEPILMAFDRPSPKFLSFLAKQYCLTQSVPQVNNFVVFEGFFLNRSAAQLRKVPLRKPEGEIKPYSMMEREAVRQEQRVPPWPFAPPHSPLRSVSSRYSPPLSVGSSPSRAAPRAASLSANQSPQSPLIERCRARRTSDQGLVARRSLYSRYLDVRPVGQQDTHLTGVRAVEELAHAPGHTDTRRSQLLSPPPPQSMPDTEDVTETQQGPVEEEDRMKDRPQLPAGGQGGVMLSTHACPLEDRDRGLLSFTVVETSFNAQWVKQKHELRNTRPW
ncbi:alpha-tubulin N-acetyltransferase 1 isoform X2 [Notolabrus celidotus]|uniref:alpha-tubulin N-acetyltransferase 1 isoform X2 n=1 Tax=Notolabrus celidotus TaxID=1203425 RepID=UPI00148F6AD8|nr:alpha-tubulin N-acetyltransferase 1 isoform X2 [Notolabrus celidotus]